MTRQTFTDSDTLDHVRLENLPLKPPAILHDDWATVPDAEPSALREWAYIMGWALLLFVLLSSCAALVLHAWESGRATAAMEVRTEAPKPVEFINVYPRLEDLPPVRR